MTLLTSYLSVIPRPGAWAIAFAIPAPVFWPYALGLSVAALGLILVVRELPQDRGLDRFIRFGRVFYTFPLAVFAGEHFTVTREISNLIPKWIPWHMFWTYLVGIALLAAALSIASKQVSALAATLLGVMFFSFVLLMDLPGLYATPQDRFMQALTLRELTFGAGAFAFASTRVNWSWLRWVPTAARYIVGGTMIFYGFKHFFHPQNVPVVPLELLVPAWIPLHSFWAYPVGAALVAAGVCLVANWNARLAAAWMGVVAFVAMLFVYLPILVKSPADIGTAMNYFADTLMMNGTFLLVAEALPKAPARNQVIGKKSPLPERAAKEDFPVASEQ